MVQKTSRCDDQCLKTDSFPPKGKSHPLHRCQRPPALPKSPPPAPASQASAARGRQEGLPARFRRGTPVHSGSSPAAVPQRATRRCMRRPGAHHPRRTKASRKNPASADRAAEVRRRRLKAYSTPTPRTRPKAARRSHRKARPPAREKARGRRPSPPARRLRQPDAPPRR